MDIGRQPGCTSPTPPRQRSSPPPSTRAAQDDIARQFIEQTKPDVILGGEDRWLPPGVPGAYLGHPDTLLIVTGDTETGGLTIETPGGTDESGDGVSAEDGPFTVRGSDLTFAIDWTTTGHTGATVPVTAIGPTAGKLTGSHPNAYVHAVMSQALLLR